MPQSKGRSAPAASSSKTLWEHFITLLGEVRTGCGAVLAVLVALLVFWLVWANYWDESPMIGELAVPESLRERGYTSSVAARRLKDALNNFEKGARQAHKRIQEANQREQHKGKGALPYGLGDFLEQEYRLDSELPVIVVPGTGLSLNAVEDAVRSLLGNTRHRVSGELEVENDRLWLRLRVDRQAPYRSRYGRVLQNPDSLFEEAAPTIVEAMRPRVVLLSETDPQKLLEMADRTIARLPKSDDDAILAYIVKSDVYRQKGEYEEAIQLLRNAIELAPHNPSPHVALGLVLTEQGDHDGAIAEYNTAIRLDQRNRAALINRGTAWVDKAEHARAILDYTTAIWLNPEDVVAIYNRGVAYSSKGTANTDGNAFERAIVDFTEAIRLDPKFAMAYNNLCSMHVARAETSQAREAELAQAIDDCGQAIRLDPGLAITYFNRGSAFYKKGEYLQATWDLSQAIKLDDTDADAFWSRGDAYVRLGDLGRAVEDYSEVIRLAPERRGIYANRGLVSYVRGDYRQAAQDLSLARERMPDEADLLLWLYLAEARSGSATAVAELDAKLEPQRWPYPVGELFRGRLSADKTLATAKDAEERCGAHFYIGEWQLIGGDRQAAVDSLQAARDICPKDSMEFMRVEAELQRLLNVSASSNGAAPATE